VVTVTCRPDVLAPEVDAYVFLNKELCMPTRPRTYSFEISGCSYVSRKGSYILLCFVFSAEISKFATP
jgi:hypothetical protein